LAPLAHIAVAHVWTPVEIRDVKKDQFGRFGRLTQIGIGNIMTA
jgi:hypothetical protein